MLLKRRSPLLHAMPIVERVSDRDICRSAHTCGSAVTHSRF
ncbi:MAG: hypothetical protein WBA57_10480 [Elainellaceae cyanobacterium]